MEFSEEDESESEIEGEETIEKEEECGRKEKKKVNSEKKKPKKKSKKPTSSKTKTPNLNEPNLDGELNEYDENDSSSNIVLFGNLIFRFALNQIELQGHWALEEQLEIREKCCYLFSLNAENNCRRLSLTLDNEVDTNLMICASNLMECQLVDSLFKYVIEFLTGNYNGYFMYFGKTIEDKFELHFKEIDRENFNEDSINDMNLDQNELNDMTIKAEGNGTNNLGQFKLKGFFNFYRNKDILLEKNTLNNSFINLADFKLRRIYTEFNGTENDRVIKSFNHRRKKVTEMN